MKLYTKRTLQVTEYGYLIETTTTVTLNIWLNRFMVWIDRRTVYNILNA